MAEVNPMMGRICVCGHLWDDHGSDGCSARQGCPCDKFLPLDQPSAAAGRNFGDLCVCEHTYGAHSDVKPHPCRIDTLFNCSTTCLCRAFRRRSEINEFVKAGGGQKFDDGKLRYDLLPSDAVAWVVAVLSYGAQKYAAENWRKVLNPRERYYSAALRHLEAWREHVHAEANNEGGVLRHSDADPDTGLPHLAHAACCILFLLAMETPSKLGWVELKLQRALKTIQEKKP